MPLKGEQKNPLHKVHIISKKGKNKLYLAGMIIMFMKKGHNTN